MACRLTGAKPWSKPCWNIVNWTLWNKLQLNFSRNFNIFIQENESESVVCEMAAILFRPQCVKNSLHCISYIFLTKTSRRLAFGQSHQSIRWTNNLLTHTCIFRSQWVLTLLRIRPNSISLNDILSKSRWYSSRYVYTVYVTIPYFISPTDMRDTWLKPEYVWIFVGKVSQNHGNIQIIIYQGEQQITCRDSPVIITYRWISVHSRIRGQINTMFHKYHLNSTF